jgi:hypothetical protein
MFVGFVVLTPVAINSSVFLDTTQCNPFESGPTFRGNMSPETVKEPHGVIFQKMAIFVNFSWFPNGM